jgi:uncharacterized tellurite resistance protein B-like protein
MASWTTLTELFERLTHPGAHAGNLREEELRLAAAALLVHALAIDGEVANEERRKLNALLQTHFGLGDDETRRLIREACRLVAGGLELAVEKAHDEIALTHLDNEVC